MKKQAICLITCGELGRIVNFVKQFKNHPEINIYIHYDVGHVDPEYKEEFESIIYSLDRVKLVTGIFRTFRFSMALVSAELLLYEHALKDEENTMFHLFSETDYLITTPNYFCEYFKKYDDFDYITYNWDDNRLASKYHVNIMNEYISQKYGLNIDFLVKACQQKSLSRKTTEKLIYDHSVDINFICKCRETRDNIFGALDEYVIPNFIFHCIGDKSMTNKRYINWHNVESNHPRTLRYSDYIDDERRFEACFIENAILQQFIVRKIDCFDEDSLKFLELFREKFSRIEAKQRKIHQI